MGRSAKNVTPIFSDYFFYNLHKRLKQSPEKRVEMELFSTSLLTFCDIKTLIKKAKKMSRSDTFAFVETKEILSHLNAAKFFKQYLPHIKNVKHKMRGTDGNKKSIDFTDTEKAEIVEAVKKFAQDVTGKIKK